MAQEIGARLGRGEVLFGAVPGGEGEGEGVVIGQQAFSKGHRMNVRLGHWSDDGIK